MGSKLIYLLVVGVVLILGTIQTVSSQNVYSAEQCRVCNNSTCQQFPRADGGCSTCICDGIALPEVCPEVNCPVLCAIESIDGCQNCNCNKPSVICPPIRQCSAECQIKKGDTGCPMCQCPDNIQPTSSPDSNADTCPPMPVCPLGCIEQFTSPDSLDCFNCNCTLLPLPFNQPNPFTGSGGNLGFRRPVGNTGFNAPFGNTGFRRPDGNTGFRRPDGNTGFRRPDGNIGFRRPDGNIGFRRPDGNTVFGRPNSDGQNPVIRPGTFSGRLPGQRTPVTCGETQCNEGCRLCVGRDGCGRCLCGNNANICPALPACRKSCISRAGTGCLTCTCPNSGRFGPVGGLPGFSFNPFTMPSFNPINSITSALGGIRPITLIFTSSDTDASDSDYEDSFGPSLEGFLPDLLPGLLAEPFGGFDNIRPQSRPVPDRNPFDNPDTIDNTPGGLNPLSNPGFVDDSINNPGYIDEDLINPNNINQGQENDQGLNGFPSSNPFNDVAGVNNRVPTDQSLPMGPGNEPSQPGLIPDLGLYDEDLRVLPNNNSPNGVPIPSSNNPQGTEAVQPPFSPDNDNSPNPIPIPSSNNPQGTEAVQPPFSPDNETPTMQKPVVPNIDPQIPTTPVITSEGEIIVDQNDLFSNQLTQSNRNSVPPPAGISENETALGNDVLNGPLTEEIVNQILENNSGSKRQVKRNA